MAKGLQRLSCFALAAGSGWLAGWLGYWHWQNQRAVPKCSNKAKAKGLRVMLLGGVANYGKGKLLLCLLLWLLLCCWLLAGWLTGCTVVAAGCCFIGWLLAGAPLPAAGVGMAGLAMGGWGYFIII